MTLRTNLEHIAGIACKVLYPIPFTTYQGRGSTVSICTLSSIALLKTISKLQVMDKILIVGRLLSENKGVDQMIGYCNDHPALRYLILCGKDTKGHFPGDALINLYKNGVDNDGKIIGTIAPLPFIKSERKSIDQFKKQIKIVDMRNCFDVAEISKIVYNLNC